MADVVDTQRVLTDLEHIAAALPEAWRDLYGAVPAVDYSRPRVAGTAAASTEPQPDRQVAAAYYHAQMALAFVRNDLARFGGPPVVRHHIPGAMTAPAVLARDIDAIRDHHDQVTVGSATQLSAAARKLAAWWQPTDERRHPGSCDTCMATDVDTIRGECEPCYRYRRRTNRPRPRHLWS